MFHYHSFKLTIVGIFVAVCLVIGAPAVLASGTHNDGDDASMKHDSYNTGKVVFHKKLSCESCALKGVELTKANAASIIDKVSTDSDIQKALSSEEREAVLHYLNKRFFKSS